MSCRPQVVYNLCEHWTQPAINFLLCLMGEWTMLRSFLPYEGDQALGQVAQRVCGVSVLEDFQRFWVLCWSSSEQQGRVRWLQRSLPTSDVQLYRDTQELCVLDYPPRRKQEGLFTLQLLPLKTWMCQLFTQTFSPFTYTVAGNTKEENL